VIAVLLVFMAPIARPALTVGLMVVVMMAFLQTELVFVIWVGLIKLDNVTPVPLALWENIVPVV
jgi:hypothetical protein